MRMIRDIRRQTITKTTSKRLMLMSSQLVEAKIMAAEYGYPYPACKAGSF
jgi:hypothetical protein